MAILWRQLEFVMSHLSLSVSSSPRKPITSAREFLIDPQEARKFKSSMDARNLLTLLPNVPRSEDEMDVIGMLCEKIEALLR